MPRSYWSGQLEISLVSFGVSLYIATEAKAQMSFRQISRSTGERVRHQKVLESAFEDRNASAYADAPVESRSGPGELSNNVVQGRRSANQERRNMVEAQSSAVQLPPEETPGTVRQDEIVKGYEYSKGKYVIIEPSELEQLRIPARHVIDIDQFIDQSELVLEYIDKPFFVTPQNDIQIKPFAIIRRLS